MDVVTKYAEAERRFVALDDRITRAADYMGEVADALIQQREAVSLANCPSASLPADVVLSRKNVSFNAIEWPSPDQVGALLSQWHTALDEMRSAWNAMPPEIRGRMTIHPALK